MKNLERWILSFFGSLDNTVLGFFTKIGPYITAAIPALLAGYGLYKQFSGSEDMWFGPIIGIAVGIGFEAAGIKIIHTAIEYSDQKQKVADVRFILLVLASFVFVALVSYTIFTADKAYPLIVRVVGGISPILAAMAYFAIGIERSLEREGLTGETRRKADDAKRKAEEARQEVELSIYKQQKEQELRLQMAKQEAESKAEIAKLEAQTKAEQARLAAVAEAEANRLRIKSEAEAHERRLEELKAVQKHEKAMEKLQKTSSTSVEETQGGSKKPFRRYDEFHKAYSKAEGNLEEVSQKMNLSLTTIRSYKRKYNQFQSEVTASTSDENDTQNLQENEQRELVQTNGNLN